jgi:hypothetical protein
MQARGGREHALRKLSGLVGPDGARNQAKARAPERAPRDRARAPRESPNPCQSAYSAVAVSRHYALLPFGSLHLLLSYGPEATAHQWIVSVGREPAAGGERERRGGEGEGGREKERKKDHSDAGATWGERREETRGLLGENGRA